VNSLLTGSSGITGDGGISNDATETRACQRGGDRNYKGYIHQYAALYEGYFEDRKGRTSGTDIASVYNRLQTALEEKLNLLTLRDRVQIPLYFCLSDIPDTMLRVDFPAKVVERVSLLPEAEHYCITAPSWEVARVLDDKLTWEDFTLTFRMRLNRAPDVYHVVIHGFLMMEPEDMNWFCSKVLDAEANQERILVEADGRRCSIHRYCPHQGADLSQGWIEQGHLLTCARHRWQFDLDNEGRCTSNDTSIHAFPIEEN
jgi:UDP-MurNAc hydroxylase